ncbi:unnamed protein product [Prorocentrum cordatum]|uniref:Ion transport domain-containing protein n=2 Tax=Prorocentrum cordatum TaxID=2364126 RepID=A0ABN9U544_9DINO|nr:unnamed protein product [Polarella glacialis]
MVTDGSPPGQEQDPGRQGRGRQSRDLGALRRRRALGRARGAGGLPPRAPARAAADGARCGPARLESGTAGGPLAGGGGGDSTVPSRCGAEAVVQTSDSDGDGQQSPRARGAEREESQEDYADTHMVSSLKRPSARPSLNSSLGTDDDANLSELRRKIISKARALLERLRRRAWWLDEEPQRSGRLAQLMDGPGFELLMGAVIVLNLWFMVHDANVKIRDPADRSMLAADVVFLVIYCSEVALKLAVHRVWYFTGAHWKMNALDLFVVVSECAALVLGTALRLSFMKVFRFLKLAKVIKAFRLMDNLKYLHAFMTCIQGSFTSFMWSVVMLFSVYGVFSLLFMQVITTHIDTTGEALDDTAFGELFGSVDRSVKTLFMVTTGGDDWISTYEVIEETGPIGSFVFLAFIAFVNLNLLNIILGIFVVGGFGDEGSLTRFIHACPRIRSPGASARRGAHKPLQGCGHRPLREIDTRAVHVGVD